MPLVFYKAEAADRGKVTFVHYNPERLSAQERALGISVDAVPEFDRLSGKSAVLYINPQTGDLWHEYVDIPTTQWVQRNEMIALMEGMPGSGVATESTLVEAVESLEGVEAKVATAGKQDAAKAVLDAIKTSAAAAATEATLAAIQTALTDGTLKAQLSGRKVQLDVIANAVSLAPGAAGEWSMGMTTEQDLYLIVDCDKAGWRLTVEQPWSTSATPDGLYPRYENAAATPVGYPKVARVIIPGANPQNGTEAANLAIGAWNINRTCRLLNQHTTDTATITIRALRIWR